MLALAFSQKAPLSVSSLTELLACRVFCFFHFFLQLGSQFYSQLACHMYRSATEPCEASWCITGQSQSETLLIRVPHILYFICFPHKHINFNQLTSFHLPVLFFTLLKTYFYSLYLPLTPTWFPLSIISLSLTHIHTHSPCISGICILAGQWVLSYNPVLWLADYS